MKIGEKTDSVQNSTHVRRVSWKTINAHLMNVIRINVPFIGHFACEKLIAYHHVFSLTNILNLLNPNNILRFYFIFVLFTWYYDAYISII